MGGSVSSLDENRCTYIRGKSEAELKNFSPHYQRQYNVALFNSIRCEIEQERQPQPQLLHRKQSLEVEQVVYEGEVTQYAEELKKWKDRYVVVKNDSSIECFENRDAYQKGQAMKCKLIPTGCKVFTSMTKYSSLVDRNFPDPSGNEKEASQCFLVNHTEYPVYLWHPYRKHCYFCLESAEAQQEFGAFLCDCIRHLDHECLDQSLFEVQAFLEGIQFFRQEKGHYGSWEMLAGDKTLILSNLVMEELLPTLQSDILPKMKGRRNEKKKTWFGIVEHAYTIVQEQLGEGLQALEEECKKSSTDLEGRIRSDMDQIISSKDFMAGKLRATIIEKIDESYVQNVKPYLASILEELMGPISSGFSEVRSLFETEVNEMSKKFQGSSGGEKLKENLAPLLNLPLNGIKMQLCYSKVHLLQDQHGEMNNSFKFVNTESLIQRTQNIMQELMDNAVFTFEQLLSDSLKTDPSKIATSIEKVKQRVLKQYDHDSSTVRKKLFQDALVEISMPSLQKALAPSCKPELQKFEQYVFADYTSLIQVENVYEEILLRILLKDVVKVVKEAASLKKHNLFDDQVVYTSDSEGNLTDKIKGKSPMGSQSGSPAKVLPESSPAEGPESGGKVVSQAATALNIPSPTSDSSLNGKQVCEEQSVSQQAPCAEILRTTSDSEQNGESVIIESDSTRLQETVCAIIAHEEVEEPTTLDHKIDNEALVGSECQNRQVVEKQEEGITCSTAPDSLKEIQNLLTVAIVPVDDLSTSQDEGVGKKESLQSKTNADNHIEECLNLVTEVSPNVAEDLKDEGKEDNVEYLASTLMEHVESEKDASKEIVMATFEHVKSERDEESKEVLVPTVQDVECVLDEGPKVFASISEHVECEKEEESKEELVPTVEHVECVLDEGPKVFASISEHVEREKEEESKKEMAPTVEHADGEDDESKQVLLSTTEHATGEKDEEYKEEVTSTVEHVETKTNEESKEVSILMTDEHVECDTGNESEEVLPTVQHLETETNEELKENLISIVENVESTKAEGPKEELASAAEHVESEIDKGPDVFITISEQVECEKAEEPKGELTSQIEHVDCEKEDLTPQVEHVDCEKEDLTSQVEHVDCEKEDLTSQVEHVDCEKEELTSQVEQVECEKIEELKELISPVEQVECEKEEASKEELASPVECVEGEVNEGPEVFESISELVECEKEEESEREDMPSDVNELLQTCTDHSETSNTLSATAPLLHEQEICQTSTTDIEVTLVSEAGVERHEEFSQAQVTIDVDTKPMETAGRQKSEHAFSPQNESIAVQDDLEEKQPEAQSL
uniref:Niban apoptosis regulator 1 n=1 Tax=Callorhinchus milii TaxID=7868 RepID=A0A4W3JK73_CALMI|eukprot:gi/632956082/ref/XP_007893783.1/ PREDICTED: protein Niban isoform X1 [Callorhinchus milii]